MAPGKKSTATIHSGLQNKKNQVVLGAKHDKRYRHEVSGRLP